MESTKLGAVSFILWVLLFAKCTVAEDSSSSEEESSPVPLVNVFDYEAKALEVLPKDAATYVKNGATLLKTVQDNVEAFSRYRLLPYHLVGLSNVDTSTTILGEQVATPIGVSPTGFQRWAYEPEGENATAKACASKNVMCSFAASSTVPMEQIVAAAPTALYWQQIYLCKEQSALLFFIRRAEQAGAKGIIVTLDDGPVGGLRYDSLRGEYSTPLHFGLGNWPNISFIIENINPGMDWDQLCWMRSQTSLKLVVKGALRPDDVDRAIQCGADALMVSNHGGRVLDGVPATIDVLPSIIEAVNGRVEVYLDSGVRTGMDVAKAIALGARAVFVGRAVWYGLAVDGQQGVEAVLDILQREFLNTMQLLGASRPEQLNPSMVIKATSCVGGTVCQ